ncbi:MAG: endonuclease/exonuclease/phosphatase family protein [Phycisphaerales bacterium]
MIRVLHWNILHGGGARRMPEIVLSLLGEAPDVILLSEYRTTIGGQIRGVLADHGLVHQCSSLPAKHKNGLLVASRFSIEGLPGSAPNTHGLSARWIDAWLPQANLHLTGLHIPDDSHPTARATCWQRVVASARVHRAQPHVFLGDFNTGRHHIDEEGRTFTCTAQLGAVATLGYADAFRIFAPDAREWTWIAPVRSRLRPENTAGSGGFRIDSALVSPALLPRMRGARYSHSVREKGISDHSAMVVEFSTETPCEQKSEDFTRETAIF